MPKVLLNGIGLHYQRRLGAPVLVMVHGLATNLAFWYLKVLPVLGHHFGVLLMDLRGHGRSDMPPSGYTTADMAEDLHALLGYLDIEKAHLVGHSYGGAVVLHYTIRYPERVLSLTLADARVRCLQPEVRLMDWPEAGRWQHRLKALGVEVADDGPDMEFRVLETLAELPTRGLAPGLALGSAFTPGAFSPFGLSRGRDRTAKQWIQLLRTTSARSDLEKMAGLTVERVRAVHQPVFAIFGEHSPCLPSCRGLQENLPNCRVCIVPGVGHFHPVVRPVFFARAVTRFIREVSAQ
jgi:pimeloyl-ACP methyl ester carboxylesterase